MEWGRLYANLADDPRVQSAEADGAAGWLLIESMCYCTRAESQGFIPLTQVGRFGGGPRLKQKVSALVREGLWIRVDNGYLLNPDIWNEERNLSDQAEKKRRADRERIAAKRAAAKVSQNGHKPPEVSRDSRGTSRATLHPIQSATCSGDSRGAEKRREDLTPPTPPAAPLWPSAVPDAKPEEGEDSRGNHNPDLDTLVAEVRGIRPAWSTRSIRRALTDASVSERPWPLVRSAMLAVARDPESRQPGRLAHDGPWWPPAITANRTAGAGTHPYDHDPETGCCRTCRSPEVDKAHRQRRTA